MPMPIPMHRTLLACVMLVILAGCAGRSPSADHDATEHHEGNHRL